MRYINLHLTFDMLDLKHVVVDDLMSWVIEHYVLCYMCRWWGAEPVGSHEAEAADRTPSCGNRLQSWSGLFYCALVLFCSLLVLC